MADVPDKAKFTETMRRILRVKKAELKDAEMPKRKPGPVKRLVK